VYCFPQAIFLCLLPSKFYITSTSFGFMRLNISISYFCVARLLTDSLFLIFSNTRYLSVLQSAPLKERLSSIIECHLLSIKMSII
jgi:hypothetical protein